MIIQELVELYGNNFKKTYSDSNVCIRKIGTEEIYDIAYDVLSVNYKYEETDIPIEETEEIL